jgi:dephospho-CoA kinase
MPILGITGGIASGKSTFRDLLVARIHAISFDADACVSKLLDEDESVRSQILERVAANAYAAGRPDRALLRKLIYDNAEKKRALEQILHPLVRAQWASEARKAELAGKPYVVDIPLLFETSAESQFDRIITVGCSLETQLARLCARDGMTLEISKKIIASQMPIGIKIAKSHHVIWNDGALDALIAQTELLSRYLHDRNG